MWIISGSSKAVCQWIPLLVAIITRPTLQLNIQHIVRRLKVWDSTRERKIVRLALPKVSNREHLIEHVKYRWKRESIDTRR